MSCHKHKFDEFSLLSSDFRCNLWLRNSFKLLLNTYINSHKIALHRTTSNNHHAKKSNKCAEKTETNGTRLANSEDACATSVDNNECDSSGSSLNSSTEENQDEIDTTLVNGISSTMKITEPALGSDWYLYCDDDFTNVSLIEEKIYEDLCYVTFSTKPEVVCLSKQK